MNSIESAICDVSAKLLSLCGLVHQFPVTVILQYFKLKSFCSIKSYRHFKVLKVTESFHSIKSYNHFIDLKIKAFHSIKS